MTNIVRKQNEIIEGYAALRYYSRNARRGISNDANFSECCYIQRVCYVHSFTYKTTSKRVPFENFNRRRLFIIFLLYV